MRVRVATYNIRKCVGLDWRRSPERVLAVIDALEADIVVLQEADKRFGRRLAALSHLHLTDTDWSPVPLALHDGGIGWHGNAILVRGGVTVEEAHRVELPTLEPRGAVVADLAVGGAPLRVVGAHLGLTGGMRVRQAHRIVAALEGMAPRPTVIMGDMNNWQKNTGCIAVFAERYRLAPPQPTFHATRPVAALDRLAFSDGIDILGQGVAREGEARRASDHLPLWADLEVRPGHARAATTPAATAEIA
ncbi:endonuclease [Acuticoccus sediminis]|uniref:Endonuclease n=1 Tax=Acuticoccus sediminis TaxID=2184697 RepID=A0A8B2NPE9_9HYPH|nr:endonuclease/exonuclease/phosphatase family protein [Acuticoccus sediminis]RAH96566.1 endonuclease [Acuticoccus sediminis]